MAERVHVAPAPRTARRYQEIVADLKRRLAAGGWRAGERLPSEGDLAREYGVSRMTCRRALEELAAQGLIYRRHGAGTFAAHRPLARDHTRLNSFFEDCRAKGIVPSVQVIRRTLEPAAGAAAEALAVDEGEPLVRIITLRCMDGVPTTLHDAQLPQRLFPWLWEAPLEALGLQSQPLWQALEMRGARIARVEERLEARLATPEVAGLLQVEPGAPILYGARVVYSDAGCPLKYADCFNRGESFFVNILLTR